MVVVLPQAPPEIRRLTFRFLLGRKEEQHSVCTKKSLKKNHAQIWRTPSWHLWTAHFQRALLMCFKSAKFTGQWFQSLHPGFFVSVWRRGKILLLQAELFGQKELRQAKKRLRFFLANAPNGAEQDCMEHETMHVRRIFFNWIEIWTKLEWKMSFTNTVWSQCGLGIHPSPFTACGKQPFCRPLMVSGGKKRQARLFSFSYKLFFVAKATKEKNEKNES